MALNQEQKFALKTASVQAVATLMAGRKDEDPETCAKRARELYRHLFNTDWEPKEEADAKPRGPRVKIPPEMHRL